MDENGIFLRGEMMDVKRKLGERVEDQVERLR